MEFRVFSNNEPLFMCKESLEFYKFFTFLFARTFLWTINPTSNHICNPHVPTLQKCFACLLFTLMLLSP